MITERFNRLTERYPIGAVKLNPKLGKIIFTLWGRTQHFDCMSVGLMELRMLNDESVNSYSMTAL